MYIGTAIGKTNSLFVRYSSTDKLLAALNYDTTGMTISEDLSVFDNLKVNGIDGSGTVTLSYLKSHVSKKESGYITSDDISRRISVSFLDSESLEAEISVNTEIGMVYAFYNMNSFEGQVTGYPAYEYINPNNNEQFYIFLENKLEEDSFNVSASFVDTGDVIFNSTATFMQAGPGLGYIYSVNLPAFDITSTLDPSDNETFNFSNINKEGSYIILGNASIMMKDLPSNSDTLCMGIGMMGSGIPIGAMGYFLSANPPYSEDFALPTDVMEDGIDSWLGSIWDETGLDEFDIYTALLADITINEAYVVKGKLDGKYVDIDTSIKPAGMDSDELGGVFVPAVTNIDDRGLANPVRVDIGGDQPGRLYFSYSTATAQLVGDGLESYDGGRKIKVRNATNTAVGGIKARLDGDTLYITTNGSNP